MSTPAPEPVEPAASDAAAVPAGTRGDHGGPEAPATGQAFTPRRRLVRELMTITAGVLIALTLEGLVQWARDLALVREARQTIAREITGNRNEIASVLGSMDVRRRNLDAALRFANDLLAKRETGINQLQLGFDVADLSTAGWESAASTGALSHMDYAEVQRYAGLYAVQAMYADRQKGSVEHLAAAATMFSDQRDPKDASAEDLQLFRRHVLAMHSDLMLEEQLGRRLIEIYESALTQR